MAPMPALGPANLLHVAPPFAPYQMPAPPSQIEVPEQDSANAVAPATAACGTALSVPRFPAASIGKTSASVPAASASKPVAAAHTAPQVFPARVASGAKLAPSSLENSSALRAAANTLLPFHAKSVPSRLATALQVAPPSPDPASSGAGPPKAASTCFSFPGSTASRSTTAPEGMPLLLGVPHVCPPSKLDDTPRAFAA